MNLMTTLRFVPGYPLNRGRTPSRYGFDGEALHDVTAGARVCYLSVSAVRAEAGASERGAFGQWKYLL